MGVLFRCTDNHWVRPEVSRNKRGTNSQRTSSQNRNHHGGHLTDSHRRRRQNDGTVCEDTKWFVFVENIDWKFLQHCFVFFISCIHTVRLYCYCLCSSHGKHMATRMFHMFGLVWRGLELKLKSKRILWLILIKLVFLKRHQIEFRCK